MPQYAFIIRHPDWDSDRYLPGGAAEHLPPEDSDQHGCFARIAAAAGARIDQTIVLQSARHGGRVHLGGPDRPDEEVVYTDGANVELTEVVSGIYVVDAADDEAARHLATFVPVATGHVEWRRIFPLS